MSDVNGHTLESVVLSVPRIGAWVAACSFVDAPDVSGAVTLNVGGAVLKGTVRPSRSDSYGLKRSCTIVAGAGAWGDRPTAKNYHNDAGVKARLVAEDVAREMGEQLGAFLPRAATIGVDYVRSASVPAARALEDAIGGAEWWVDYQGLTHVGARAASTLSAAQGELTAYDVDLRQVELTLDDVAALQIGTTLTKGLDTPQVVYSYDITVADTITARARVGGADTDLAATFAALVKRTIDASLFGKYRYRVVQMQGQRVACQAVRKGAGLPDVAPLSMWPGVAGAHATLTPGAEVLVEFIEGNRAMPVITHFAGADGAGFVPVELAFAGGTAAVARVGDSVETAASVGQTITFGAPAASGPMVLGVAYPFTLAPLKWLGTITSGSPKVKA